MVAVYAIVYSHGSYQMRIAGKENYMAIENRFKMSLYVFLFNLISSGTGIKEFSAGFIVSRVKRTG